MGGAEASKSGAREPRPFSTADLGAMYRHLGDGAEAVGCVGP